MTTFPLGKGRVTQTWPLQSPCCATMIRELREAELPTLDNRFTYQIGPEMRQGKLVSHQLALYLGADHLIIAVKHCYQLSNTQYDRNCAEVFMCIFLFNPHRTLMVVTTIIIFTDETKVQRNSLPKVSVTLHLCL